jgi:hypothetical protein
MLLYSSLFVSYMSYMSYVYNINFNLLKNVPWSFAILVFASKLADAPLVYSYVMFMVWKFISSVLISVCMVSHPTALYLCIISLI